MAGGSLTALNHGATRQQVGDALVDLALAHPELAVGLDFAFSFPAWYLHHLGVRSGIELWERAEREGEAWLAGCTWPLWGRTGHPRPDLGPRAHLRRADLAVPPTGSGRIRPKSPFQIGGAGAVGTGSIRGMPLLARLRREGFWVWPFEARPAGRAGGWPRVVEIYPRSLTGPVVKSQKPARRSYLDLLGWPPDPGLRAEMAASDDAFDAAVSARAMDAAWEQLASLPETPPAGADEAIWRLEGEIWAPRSPG